MFMIFYFQDDAKTNRKEGKKTWILDPGSKTGFYYYFYQFNLLCGQIDR